MSALFDLPTSEPGPQLGADARRTNRQLDALTAGVHPVVKIRLHPDAPPAGDREAPGPRCGTCVHLFRHKHHDRTYLKCAEGPTSHGPGTDIRAWWPACIRFEENR